jgi:hypothetical protein
MKNHNTFKKHDSIHRDRDISWAAFELVSGLEIIVLLDSEDMLQSFAGGGRALRTLAHDPLRFSKSQLPCLPCSSQRLLSLVCDYFIAISDTVKAFLHTYLVVFEASLSSTLKDHPRTIMNHQT